MEPVTQAFVERVGAPRASFSCFLKAHWFRAHRKCSGGGHVGRFDCRFLRTPPGRKRGPEQSLDEGFRRGETMGRIQSKRRIALIVEDDAEVRQLMKMVIEEAKL